MKPKTKFIKFYKILSDNGRSNLVYEPYNNNPMSINVLYLEIINDTKLGNKLLKEILK